MRAKAKVIGGDQTNIGGIVGKAYDSSVVLADATVDLSGGIHSNIGGIVGDADNSQFKDLNVRGKLSVRESGDYGTSWVGGIAGLYMTDMSLMPRPTSTSRRVPKRWRAVSWA